MANEFRMPEMTFRRPLGELYLGNKLRAAPTTVVHFFRVTAHCVRFLEVRALPIASKPYHFSL
jgi:hypothetical protein